MCANARELIFSSENLLTLAFNSSTTSGVSQDETAAATRLRSTSCARLWSAGLSWDSISILRFSASFFARCVAAVLRRRFVTLIDEEEEVLMESGPRFLLSSLSTELSALLRPSFLVVLIIY